MAEKVRDLELQSARLGKDLDDLMARTRFAASPRSAAEVEALIKEILGESDDVVFRRVQTAAGETVLVVHIDGLAEAKQIEEAIIQPLIAWRPRGSHSLAELERQALFAGECKTTLLPARILEGLLRGEAVIATPASAGAAIVSVTAPGRGVENPLVEIIARGPRDSFTETARQNIALVRRRLPDPNLRVHRQDVGVRSRTRVFVLYLDDVVNRAALEELQRRVAAVRIDGILDSGMLEQLIEDNWWTPFPQMHRTERPDVAAAALLEGRLCVIVDNTPLAIIAPTGLDGLFHSPEDIYDRPFTVNLLRLVRFIASLTALTLPALYVSVASFNPGLLPLKLALRVAASREGVALPVVFEALLMQLFLETLREAGFRLPSPLGQTFGIVGGIVLGQLGVRAGLASEMMVVVIALTAVSSFAAPSLILGTSIRLLGLPLLIASASFGIFGFVLALSALLSHLVTLRSLGVPYLVPYVFYPASDFKDTILRGPLPAYKLRPSLYGPQQRVRLEDRREERGTSTAGQTHTGEGNGEP